MTWLATEFPLRTVPNRATFVALVIAWLRGTKYSSLLEDCQQSDLEREAAYLRSRNGEELRLRETGQTGGYQAIGFRHDFPDAEGRLWRTEVVVRGNAPNTGSSLMRLRTQCIAREPGARLASPRKPYYIKLLLNEGYGGRDGAFDVCDQPHWLTGDEASLDLARDLTLGRASGHLPTIYVSALGASRWLLSKQEIAKLAFDLGGIAHIVVEPDRAFSFLLRDLTKGANVYGGTLGISVPNYGIVRRLYQGLRLQDSLDLLAAARLLSTALRSQMPAEGWDWADLQDHSLRMLRERDRNRLSVEEKEQLYEEEIGNLKEQIAELKGQLAVRPTEASPHHDEEALPEALLARLGPEIYSGEFLDRIRLVAAVAEKVGDQVGLDERSRAVVRAILANLPLSPGCSELREDLKRATKDPKRLAPELTSLLARHGYRAKSDNKHIRLEPKDGYAGIESITLPKTPSDHRSLENSRKQIEKALGISQLRA